MFHKEISSTDMKVLTVASVFLTLPFIFYARDIAHSLRDIAEKR
ncbi:MAG: hypothetical protein A4E53_03662 [Pelotomaculum sp. PtaB.Bin104]|nr:MAG: hypothetical protein A4E53_03662 [Pelotomaculum sp. PtaB.Bin104]